MMDYVPIGLSSCVLLFSFLFFVVFIILNNPYFVNLFFNIFKINFLLFYFCSYFLIINEIPFIFMLHFSLKELIL